MDFPPWGMLEKSQVDPETIEEAIARLILGHNEDETAHLGTGQSLQSHKASEIIDHLIESIIADKLADKAVKIRALDVIYVNSSPMQMEGAYRGVTGTATITDPVNDIGIILQTGTTLNSVVNFFARGMYEKNQTWDRERMWKSAIKLFQLTAQVFRFGIGYMGDDSPHARHVGFLLNNGALWATVGNGTIETKIPLTSPPAANPYYYKIHFWPGVKAEFYVDGVLNGTISINLPSGTIDPWNTFHAYLKNTAAANKIFQIFGYEFQQNL